MTLASSTALRYTLFFSMYFMQGLVPGLALTALVNHYLGHGATLTEIGTYIAIIGLPWSFQIFWAPFIDQLTKFKMGRRRPWLVLSNFASFTALMMLLFLGDGVPKISTVALIFFFHSIFASISDLAVDAIIVDLVPPEQLGRNSAFVRAGFVSGGAVGTVLFSWMLSRFGFQAAASLLVVLWGSFSALSFIWRERTRDFVFSFESYPNHTVNLEGLKEILRATAAAVRKPNLTLLLALSFMLNFVVSVFQLTYTSKVIQGGFRSQEYVSNLQAAALFFSGTIGAFSVGSFCDWLGHTRGLRYLLGACAVGFVVVLSVLKSSGANSPLIILGLSNILPALLYVSFLPVIMENTAKAIAATQFTLFMTAMNLGDIGGGFMAGRLERFVTVQGLAIFAIGFFALAGSAVWYLDWRTRESGWGDDTSGTSALTPATIVSARN